MTFARKMIKFAGLLLMTVLLFGVCSQALAVTDPVEFTMQVTPDSLTAPGDVQVSLKVANAGNADMKDPVTLYDPAGNVVASFGDGGSVILPAGAFKTWEGTWSVTEDQLDQGKVAYTLKYYLEDENGELVAINSTADAPVKFTGEKAELTVKRTVTPEVVRETHDVTVTYELHNNGNVTLKDIRVREDIAKSQKTQTVKELQPGARTTVTFTSRMGKSDLISKASISYKAGDAAKAVTQEVGELIIPRANPDLDIELSSPVTGVNVGEAAKILVTFINKGNVSYSNVTVTDKNKGEIFTNLSIPAGATVTEEKEFILTEKTTFEVTATLPNNTGDVPTLSSNELVMGVYDPQKQLILSLNLESDRESVEQTPADMRFILTVTNNSNIKAENVVISHGDKKIATIDELGVGEIRKIIRDVTISQPGRFCFTATAKDTMNNEVSFSSNEKKIEIARKSGSAAVPVSTAVPAAPVMPTTVPVQPVDPVLSSVKEGFKWGFYVVGGLFALLFLLFAAATVVRVKNKSKSKAAYDHLELSERRDYTEPSDQEPDEVRTEWKDELTPVRPLQEEMVFQPQQPMPEPMNPEGAYRISRNPDERMEMPQEGVEKRSAVQFLQGPEEEE